MIPKIKSVKPLENFILYVVFDDGKTVYYDVKDDINTIADFQDLESIHGLFLQVQLDQSRTCIYWNDRIDLPSDTSRATRTASCCRSSPTPGPVSAPRSVP